MSEKLAIGIDLGTTHCCVGVFKDGKVQIVPNEDGNRSTPSYVAFTDDGVLVGDAAKSQVSRNPRNTVYDTKNIIGAVAKDPGSLQYIQRMWPFELISEADGLVKIRVVNRGIEETYTPEEICGMILSKLKEAAGDYLGCNVTNAVITVPANCGVIMRKATYLAANLAGLEVLRIINEPTAAAVAYTHECLSGMSGEHHVVVFDLGGGTLDVSLLSIDEGICEVISSKGASVGGEDFTNNLLMYLVKEFRRREKLSALDQRAIRRLKKASEETKIALSFQSQIRVDLEALFDGRDFSITITRELFEEINSSLFATIIDVLNEAVVSTQQSEKFKEVILVGGSSRIPKIQTLIQEHFDFKATLNKRMNFDEAVAAGAAIQAAILSGNNYHSLSDIILLDVCPVSLGVETSGGGMVHIVKVNDTIPKRSSRIFQTADKQSDMFVKIYEGESDIASENNLVRQFRLANIQSGKLVELCFDIDANGSLAVIPTLITQSSELSEEEVLVIDGCPDDLISEVMEVKPTEKAKQAGSDATSSTQRTETIFSCSSSNSSNQNAGSSKFKNIFSFSKKKK